MCKSLKMYVKYAQKKKLFHLIIKVFINLYCSFNNYRYLLTSDIDEFHINFTYPILKQNNK